MPKSTWSPLGESWDGWKLRPKDPELGPVASPDLDPILFSRFTKIQNTKLTMKQDGIASVRYRVLEVSRQPLFTNITVDIGRPPSRPPWG